MAAASMMRLKLLVDTIGKKVLFAEAGKDLVDFLSYLLSLPGGAVFKLLKEKSLVGCLDKLHEIIENLSETYTQPNQDKNSVLNSKSSICATQIPLLLPQHESETRKFYTCPTIKGFHKHYNVSDVPSVHCPQCKVSMTQEMSYISPAPAETEAVVEEGSVKGLVTYKFNIKDLSFCLSFRIKEGLKLLQASMECKNVLTSVLFVNKGRSTVA